MEERYRILRSVKRGGAAEVFEAVAVGAAGFERRVAMKRLGAEHLGDASMARAFADEAHLLSQLHHSNVVSVLDVGMLDGLPFQILEWVDGLDAETALGRAGTVPPRCAARVAAELAAGLAYVHAASDREGRALGLVHRDVSPDNVLLSWEGDVKLADFGVAYAHQRLERTEVGVVKGKLAYMAPEQLRGDPVDGRADIFSLGCLLHCLLTGKSPVVRQTDDPQPQMSLDPGLPPRLHELLARATHARLEQRPASAAIFAAELRAALGSSGLAAKAELAGWLRGLIPRSAPRAALDALFELAPLEEPGRSALRRYTSVAVAAPYDPTEATEGPDLKDRNLGLELHGYRLEECIGVGAMARVYRAQHVMLDRQCAVKVMADLPQDAKGRRRFEREAQALSLLRHPNVVEVLGYGLTPDGRPFFSMSLLEGVSLRRLLETSSLPVGLVARVARELAQGLAAAHAVGVLHRDLKPANIMLTEEQGVQRAKILDFGCVRSRRTDRFLTQLTRPGAFVGTPAYAAPEQIRDASGVDERADLYALGGVLYAMLVGHAPFRGDAEEVMRLKQTTLPPPPPDASGLGLLAMRLLSIRPEDRPASAQEVLRLLSVFEEDQGADTRLDLRAHPRSSWLPDSEVDETESVTPPAELSLGPPAEPDTTLVPGTGSRRGLHRPFLLAAVAGAAAGALALSLWVSRARAPAAPPRSVEATRPSAQPAVAVVPQAPPVEESPPPPRPTGGPEVPAPARVRRSGEPAAERDPRAALERMRQRLELRGLTFAELRAHGAEAELQAYEDALRRRDRAEEARAEEALLAAARRVELSNTRLGRRLDQVERSLAEDLSWAPRDTARALERRMLELRERLSRAGSGREELARAIDLLEADVARAAGRGAR